MTLRNQCPIKITFVIRFLTSNCSTGKEISYFQLPLSRLKYLGNCEIEKAKPIHQSPYKYTVSTTKQKKKQQIKTIKKKAPTRQSLKINLFTQ